MKEVYLSYETINAIIHNSTRIANDLQKRNLRELALQVNQIREDLISSLKEDNMADTAKPWYASKTIWSDILTILVGFYGVLVPVLTGYGINLPTLDSGLLATILTILAGLGIYGRKTASVPVK